MRVLFHDRHDRLSYLKARAGARRLRQDPALVEAGRDWLERFVAPDPHQGAGLQAWRRVLALPAADIAELLEADLPEAQWLRETRPVFCVLPAAEMAALVEEARRAC